MKEIIQNNEHDINGMYWTLHKLIMVEPEKYLNERGQILLNIIDNKGITISQRKICRQTKITYYKVRKNCRQLNDEQVILMKKNNGKNMYILNDKIVIGTRNEIQRILRRG